MPVLTYRPLGVHGRLGNQLWHIASTIGIAHALGEQAVFPPWRFRPYFSIPDAFFSDRVAVEGEDLAPDCLQELKHFSAIEPFIRQIFTPSAHTWEAIARYHRRLVALPNRTAVNIRRGDYLDLPDNYVQVSLRYYEEAMSITSPPYLIFSDDIAWCRQNFPSDCTFMPNNRDYEDLMLIASCDAVISANSTYSWWGAWLSRGRRIFPRQWFGPGMAKGTPYSAKLDPELMFPEDCVVLDS